MKLRNLALFALVCALVVPAYAAGIGKAGKWQMTMEMDMPGMPMKMPPVSVTHCVTKEQAENPEAAIPKNNRDSDCKYSDVKVDGSTVSWKVECAKSKTCAVPRATIAGMMSRPMSWVEDSSCESVVTASISTFVLNT